MADLKRLLERLESHEPPELWPEIEDRGRSLPGLPPLQRRWPTAAVALVASGLALALVASAFLFGDNDPPGVGPAQGDVFFPTWASSARPAGIVEGRLVERRGCLFLESGSRLDLALWERGYTYDSGVLKDPSGQPVVRVGETVFGGGGYGSDWAAAEEIVGESIPSHCRPTEAEGYAVVYDIGTERPSPQDR